MMDLEMKNQSNCNALMEVLRWRRFLDCPVYVILNLLVLNAKQVKKRRLIILVIFNIYFEYFKGVYGMVSNKPR